VSETRPLEASGRVWQVAAPHGGTWVEYRDEHGAVLLRFAPTPWGLLAVVKPRPLGDAPLDYTSAIIRWEDLQALEDSLRILRLAHELEGT
jgi:hypothetical protein